MRMTRDFEPAEFIRYFALSSIILLSTVGVAFSQTTAFSYQGSLFSSGMPANGNYDFQFKLFDAFTGGTQQGPTITKSPVAVTNGGFTVTLDFGAGAFPGAARYLEISVQPTGGLGFTTLSPRTEFLSAPYAMTAIIAQTAATVTGPITGNDATATLSITNSATGVTPPLNNPNAPAALKAEATSTAGVTAGLFGISDAPYGIGVVGIANGSATPFIQGAPANGVFGLALSTTGAVNGVMGQSESTDGAGVLGLADAVSGFTAGVFAKSISPDGVAIIGVAQNGGDILQLFSPTPGGNPKLRVDTTGTVFVKGFVTPQLGVITDGTLQAKSALLVGGTIPGGPANFNVSSSGDITTNGNLTVAGSLTVTGTKSSVAKLNDGRSVLLYAVEAPENWFEDFGMVKLVNGRAVVKINSTFIEATNTTIPYEVFLTPNGSTRGLYVTRKTATSFEVCENRRGRSNISVDYRIVAKRRGHEAERFAPSPTKEAPTNQ